MSAAPIRPATGPILAPVAALLVSVGLLIMGNGLQSTLLPIRAGFEDFSATDIGLLGSFYYIGFIAGCLAGPYIIMRAGHIRTFTALVALASAAALAHPLAIDPVAWMMFRALTGFCLAGLYLVIESWLNERATNQTRGVVMSSYIVVNFSVITVGQLLVTLYEPTSFALFSLASILVSLAAVPVALTRSAQPAPITLVRFRPKKLFALSPAGAAGVLMIGVINGSFWSLGPFYARGTGLSVTATAIFMSVAVVGGALAQWPLGRISDRFDRRRVLLGICLATAAASLGLTLLGGMSPAVQLALGFLFGATSLPGYAIAAAHTYDHADPSDYVEVSAGLLLLNGIGSAAGPIAAALLIGSYGPLGLFAFTCGVALALAAFVVTRLRARAPVPAAAKEDFDLASTAAVVVAGDTEALEASPLVGTEEELKREADEAA